MAHSTAPTPATTTITAKRCTIWCGDMECPEACPNQVVQEVKHTPSCPLCSEPIRNPAGYVQLLAYQAAIGAGAMTTEEAAALLLRDEPPDAAA